MSQSIEPRQPEITARLAGQGAMLEELHSLLPLLKPESARSDARRAIVDDNALRRSSLGSRAKLFKKMAPHYFSSNAPQATAHLVRALQATPDSLQAGLLAYTMLLWNDGLVFHLGCEWLAPRLAGPSFSARTADIEAELEHLAGQSPAVANWTPTTRNRVAQHYLGLLRDCGYASGSARKLLRQPFVSPPVVLFGARLILGGGEPASRIPEHRLFHAMGLSLDDVIAALTELRSQGQIDFALQGGVAQLAFRDEAK